MTIEQNTPENDFDWEPAEKDPAGSPEPPQQSVPSPVKPPTREGQEGEKLTNLNLLLDIPLEITAELGRTRMIIHDLLQLGQGSVIELNKLAGEPLEILVNHKLIARGEVVVVNEKFGIRLTDIISPMERIKQLA
jgi:flagellar motor switch protein FliN/FliY